MGLFRLDKDSFSTVEQHWAGQCKNFGEDFREFASERMDHAKGIANEVPPDGKYGIFCLGDPNAPEALVHVNRATLPGTDGHTLRLVWILLAPRFDFDDVGVEEFSRVSAGIIYGALEISDNNMEAIHVKIHLGNFFDRQFFAGVAAGLKSNAMFTDVRVRGNWFHISKKLKS